MGWIGKLGQEEAASEEDWVPGGIRVQEPWMELVKWFCGGWLGKFWRSGLFEVIGGRTVASRSLNNVVWVSYLTI